MAARVLAIANCKGGSGKSTTAVNLAMEFSLAGCRTLVVDLDPQGHAGLGFGIRSELGRPNAHSAFRATRPDLAPGIQGSAERGLHVLPADRGFDGQLGTREVRALAGALDPLRPDFDLMLIDVPPASPALSVQALMACDGIVVPATLDPLGLDGVRQFARAYGRVALDLGAAALGLAVAPMRIDARCRGQSRVLDQLRADFGPSRVTAGIRQDTALADAFAHGRPLRRFKAWSRAVGDYATLAGDVATRFRVPSFAPAG